MSENTKNSDSASLPSATGDQGYEKSSAAYYTLGVLTIVYSFNFIDRQLLSILQEPIKNELSLSDSALSATLYTLADNVSAFTFIYYQIDGTTTTTVDTEIEFVEFDLTITADGNDYQGKTRVALKNL